MHMPFGDKKMSVLAQNWNAGHLYAGGISQVQRSWLPTVFGRAQPCNFSTILTPLATQTHFILSYCTLPKRDMVLVNLSFYESDWDEVGTQWSSIGTEEGQ